MKKRTRKAAVCPTTRKCTDCIQYHRGLMGHLNSTLRLSITVTVLYCCSAVVLSSGISPLHEA